MFECDGLEAAREGWGVSCVLLLGGKSTVKEEA